MSYHKWYKSLMALFSVMGVFALITSSLLTGVAHAETTAGIFDSLGSTTRISISDSGVQGNGDSTGTDISSDGRYIVYSSTASNLVANDINNKSDVFLYDRVAQKVTLVSKDSNSVQGNGDSKEPSISATGRYVVFTSNAPNFLGSEDPTANDNIFLKDTQSNTLTLVSVGKNSETANGNSNNPEVSQDGRYVVFDSTASNLVETDNNAAVADVFIRDMQSRTTTIVSVSTGGEQGNAYSAYPEITPDGRFVVFVSRASNLVVGDTDPSWGDVFLHDTQSHQTTMLSIAPDGVSQLGEPMKPSISDDGRYVTFSTQGPFWLRDNLLSKTTLLPRSIINEPHTSSDISPDGRYIARTYVTHNTVRRGYVLVYDQLSGDDNRITIPPGQGSTFNTAISNNGQFVVFASTASTIVPNDTNGKADVFIHNVIWGADSGFRLDRDAWNFRNRAFVPELKHIVGAFGEAGIYTTDLFGNQTPIDTAEKMLSPSVGAGGACFGFAATSGLLVNGDALGLTPPISPFSNTFAIPDPGEHIVGGEPYFNESAVADFIIESFYHQFSIEFENEMVVSKNMSLANKLSAIKHAVRWDGFSSDPLLINLSRRSDNCNNHTVLPISFQEFPDGRVEVFIYDPNNPFGSNERQSIVFDLVNNSWNYQLNGFNARFGSDVTCTLLSGQQASGKIDIVHARTFSTNTTPAWWKVRLLNSPYRVWLEIFGSVATVTDESGNKLGDVNGTLVENIPDSFIFSPFGQFAANPVNWYVVKADKPLTATVSYNNTPDDSLVVIADKATFDVGLKQGVTATDTLVIDSVANKVSLTGDGKRVITTTRLFTNTEQIFTLHFNLDQAHSLSVQGLDNGSLKVVSGTPQQGATLTLEQNGGTGAVEYQVTLPPLQPGDAQIVTPNWNNDSVTVGTDVGNNGSIDTTVTVEGEQPPPPALHVYLPLIQKK